MAFRCKPRTADTQSMRTEELALVRGWADTRATLASWRAHPRAILRAWLAGSLAVTGLLLSATWVVAVLSVPDTTPLALPGDYVYPG